MKTMTTITKLFALAGGFVIAVGMSHSATKLLFPSLFHYWGIVLIALLGIWSLLSSHLLLKQTARSLQWLILGLIALLSVLGSHLPWGGLASILLMLLAIALLVLITLTILGLGQLRVRVAPQWLLFGFVPVLTGILVVTGINLRPAPPATPPLTLGVDEQLRYLADLDQRDRQTGRFILDASRDQARLQRVLLLDQSQQIVSPTAQYQAALILQHGSCAQHFQRAYELATAAAKARIPQAASLAQASYDRWMLSIQQPQKYNTQWLVNPGRCQDPSPANHNSD